ncbi:MAG: acyloxyacyl hydrolase [Desulfobacter sp.]|uniref:acyloxyacyl hydrolase n=1 Tax=Desulfobacter sp. TaxID=2294 RepID=UPI001B3EC12A|nr:acyloxyacyl hydrolase [Desulfobacter sp.]MBP8830003.1 acyloxyacyl hydrolase [Desulfobacter sp.]
MKSVLFLLICFLATSNYVAAQDHFDFGEWGEWGVSLGYGQSIDHIDIYRAGFLKQLNAKWIESKTGYARGYFELSYNRWESGREDVNAVAFSPVFQYVFYAGNATWYPYIEAGVGVACLDDYTINDRNLSSNLLFEDRAGAGIRIKNVDISLRYMHYSNARLKEPNDGIDILIGTLAWYF